MFLPFVVVVAIFFCCRCRCCCLFLFTVCCYCIHIEMILHCWIGLTMLHHLVYSLFSSLTSCCVCMYVCSMVWVAFICSRWRGPYTCQMTFAKHKFLMAYQTNTHDLSTIYVCMYVCVVRFYAHFSL